MKNVSLTALAVSIAVGGMGIATVASAKTNGPKLPSFEELDTNGDGVITQAEVDAIGEAKFAESDTNGDGYLDAGELSSQIQSRNSERRGGGKHGQGGERGKGPKEGHGNTEMMQAQQAERLELAVTHMIQRADADGDGQLSIDEMRPPKAGKMFARIDADGNGEVTLEEWEAAKSEHGNRDQDS